MHTYYRTILLIAVVLLVGWTLGGCGGGGGTSPVSPTSAVSIASVGGPTVRAKAADPDRVIIGLKQPLEQSTKDHVARLGGEVRYAYQLVPAMAARLSQQGIQELKSDPNVAYVIPDTVCVALAQTVPWGITRIHADTVFGAGNSGAGVKVADIDTGIDYTHPDLAANYAGGYDFVNHDSDPMDDNGHGTHTAGTIAAINNTIGVVGVAPQASIYSLKVLDSTGSGYFSDVIAALQWCVTNHMQVASMSFGSDGNPGFTTQQACDAAYAANVLLVAAAGNSGAGADTVGYPAHYSSVIAVAATDSSNNRASFSSTGTKVELAAPGVGVLSTLPGGTYASWSGTSMATPHVTGAAALVIASGVTGASAVRARLVQTAHDLGTVGRDSYYGYGLVDALAATAGTPPPSVGAITGTVTDSATTLAISGATVQTDTGQSAQTGPSGSYTISNVPAGSRTVTASATGYTSQAATVQVNASQTTTVNFALVAVPAATGAISGKVTNSATTQAISGATVQTDTGQSAQANLSGVYTINNVPTGSRQVTASATGFTSQTATAQVNAGQTTTKNFALVAVPPPAPTGTISGTVRDYFLRAISGATVQTDTGQSATTNSSGQYTIANVPAGIRRVTASATGHTSVATSAYVIAGRTATVNFYLH